VILHSQVHESSSPDAAPLLLIHGLGSATSAWKPILNELKKTFTVVTVDLPGHGATPMAHSQRMDPQSLAEAVIATMHELGFQRFHVVGNSLGGWIALEMAAMNPNSIYSVTGLAPAGLWLAPIVARYPGLIIARMLANGVNVVSPLLLHYEWARKIGFGDVSPRWREFSYELCLDATHALATAAGYYPAWDALLKMRFDSPIRKNIPITIIFGDTDKTLPASICQERSLVPSHTRWLVFEDCGHAPMWDHPQEVIDEILRTTSKR